MTDGFEWEEGDGKWTKYESTNERSTSAIYNVTCPECGEEVGSMVLDPDPDSVSWSGECRDCELCITLRPSKIDATASEIDL